MTDPWRQRCPKGHSSVTLYDNSYYCNACSRSYNGEPYDAARTEFPVEGDDPRPKGTRDEVLEEVVRLCNQPTTTRVRAREIPVGSPKQVGAILSELRSDGLVEKLGSSSPNGYKWRPTDDGIRSVVETEQATIAQRDTRVATDGGRSR